MAATIEIVAAPVPATSLPKAKQGKVRLRAKNNVPEITSTREIRPTLKEPMRSERVPAKIAKKMDGNVNKLINNPALEWVRLNSLIIRGRTGGKD